MANESATDWFGFGCAAAALALLALLGAAGYGAWSFWERATSTTTCETLVVETPRGERRWWAPAGTAPLTYDLDGSDLTANLPPGTQPEDGNITINDVRAVRCLQTIPEGSEVEAGASDLGFVPDDAGGANPYNEFMEPAELPAWAGDDAVRVETP